ncbi:hypothetical protein AB1N83_014482 [Pleurotus pulmonarius]
MSNQTENHTQTLKVLTGSNWNAWEGPMTAFLKSKGLWMYVDGSYTLPSPADDSSPTTDEIKLIREWRKEDGMALGYITLYIAANLNTHVKENAKETWESLKAQYAGTNTAAAFEWLKQIMNFKISSHSAPHADIAKFRTAAAKLNELGQPISDQLLALILLAALPKEYESVAQLTVQTKLADLNLQDIIAYLEAEWQRRELNKLQQPRHNNANKLSAVKGKGKPPQFQQQKQQGNKNAEAGPSKLPQSDGQQKKRKRVRKGTKGQGHAHAAIPDLPSSGFAQMLNMSRLPIVEDQRSFPPLPTDPARRLINQIVAPQPQQWYDRTTHSASSSNQSAPQFEFRVGTPPRQLVGLNGPELTADTRPSVMISGSTAKAVKLAGLHQMPKPKFFNNRHKEETPQKYQGSSKPVHRGGDYETHLKARQLLDLMPDIPQSMERIRRLEKIAGKLPDLSNSDMVERTAPKIVEIPDTPSDGEDEEMEPTPKRHRSATPYPDTQDVDMVSLFSDTDEPGPEPELLNYYSFLCVCGF